MRRIAPSTTVREDIDQLLRDGVGREANLLSQLAERSSRRACGSAAGTTRRGPAVEAAGGVGRRAILAHVRAIRDAATHEAGEAAAATVIERYAGVFPAAMACLSDDLEASLAHLKLPVRHRINVRTTNLIERSFVEERRRTKVIPRFPDEKAAMKLVFATLIRAAAGWNRVAINDLERQQLKLLRQRLGIDPPPAGEKGVRRSRTRKAA